MHWQMIVVLALIAAAVVYIVVDLWRALTSARKKTGCGSGCGTGCSQPPSGAGSAPVIPAEAIKFKPPRRPDG